MQHRNISRFVIVMGVLLMALVVGIMPAFASGLTLPEIDPQPIFDSIATYLPWVFAILSIPAGIVLAVKLAQFIINAFSKAFGGGKA